MVYKFLQNGYYKYFEPFLKHKHNVHNTRRSPTVCILLVVTHFASSLYKSTKHFSFSCTYDAPKTRNDFPDDICSTTSLSSFRKKLKTYLFAKANPKFLALFHSFSVTLTPAMSLVIWLWIPVFQYDAPRACL